MLLPLPFAYLQSSDDDDAVVVPSKHQRKTTNAKTAALKAELKELLAQPLIARGVSTRYITSGSRPIVDDVIKGECEYIHQQCSVSKADLYSQTMKICLA